MDHSKMHFEIFEWSSKSDIMAKVLRTVSIIKICNIKLIRSTKLEKTANNWIDHSKQPTRHMKKILKNQPDLSRTCRFRRQFTETLYFRIKSSNIHHLLIDFRQNRRKVKKWSFWPREKIIEWLINYAWPAIMAKCWETFRIIIICNIKSIRGPKLQKMPKTRFHE